MKARCQNKANKAYPRYGGRGITVCERWLHISGFLEDMQEGYREGLSLDRIDNDKGYNKENCRWATAIEQARNKRNNHIISIGGMDRCLTEWCEIFNLNVHTAQSRITYGWTYEEIFGVDLEELDL
jgi:hypothetical protein